MAAQHKTAVASQLILNTQPIPASKGNARKGNKKSGGAQASSESQKSKPKSQLNKNCGGKKCFRCTSNLHLAKNCTAPKEGKQNQFNSKMPMVQPHNGFAETYMPLQYQAMPTRYGPVPSNNISMPYQLAVPNYAYDGNDDSTNHEAKQNVLGDYAASQVIPGTKQGKTVGCPNCAKIMAENDWLRVELQAELEKLRSKVIEHGAKIEKYGSRAMELYEKQKSEIMERERISAELKKLRCDIMESVDPQQRSMLNSL